MDDVKGDEAFRELSASVFAQGFLIELLLARYLKLAGDEGVAELAGAIQRSSLDTTALSGVAKDESDAEFLADVTIKMQQVCEGMIDRAVFRATGKAR